MLITGIEKNYIHTTSMSNDEAVVAVFGDLGRSPRMINHTRELLKLGYNVHLIGYAGGTVYMNK